MDAQALGGLGVFGIILVLFAVWTAWSSVKIVPQGFTYTCFRNSDPVVMA